MAVRRPIATFAVAALLGAFLSLSISVALVAIVAAIAGVFLIGYAWRNLTARGGAIFGWGMCWFLLIGSNYVRCVSMGPDCGGADGMVAFVGVGGALALAGIGLATLERVSGLYRRFVKGKP